MKTTVFLIGIFVSALAFADNVACIAGKGKPSCYVEGHHIEAFGAHCQQIVRFRLIDGSAQNITYYGDALADAPGATAIATLFLSDVIAKERAKSEAIEALENQYSMFPECEKYHKNQ